MVDSAISYAILKYARVIHRPAFYDGNNFNVVGDRGFEKIYLEPDHFKMHYNRVTRFYNRLNRADFDNSANIKFIDYSEFGHNVDLIPELLGFKLLGKLTNVMLIQKNPSKKDQIINFDEISNIAESLERNPNTIIKNIPR
jgi:hypothetical protein